MDQETESVLRRAASEIRQLRQQNAILGAKVEMIDLFAMVLHSSAAQRSQWMAEDIAWRIDQLIEAKQAPKEPAASQIPPAPST